MSFNTGITKIKALSNWAYKIQSSQIFRKASRIYHEAKPYLAYSVVLLGGGVLSINMVLGKSTPKTAEAEVRLINDLGLHARVAGWIFKTVSEFEKEHPDIKVTIVNAKSRLKTSAKEITDMTGLMIKRDMGMRVIAEGEGASEIVQRIIMYARLGFGEIDEKLAQEMAPDIQFADIESVAGKRLEGAPIVMGIESGRVTTVKKPDLSSIEEKNFGEEILEDKLRELNLAIDKVSEEIETLIERIGTAEGASKEEIDKLGDYQRLLPVIRAKAVAIMKEKLWNTKGTMRILVDTEESMGQQEQVLEDIRNLTNRIIEVRYGLKRFVIRDISEEEENIILVAEELGPIDAAQLMSQIGERIKVILTEKGTEKSHLGVMTKNRGIVSIFGIDRLMRHIKDGDYLIIDAVKGIVFINPKDKIKRAYVKTISKFNEAVASIRKERSKEIRTKGEKSVLVRIHGNGDIPPEIKSLLETRINGDIALVRTEGFMMIDKHGNCRTKEPSTEEHFAFYLALLKAAKGYPIRIRTFDVGGGREGDKFLPYLYPPEKSGIALVLDKETHSPYNNSFINQLEALLSVSGKVNKEEQKKVSILFPMVENIEQIKAAHESLENLKSRVIAAKEDYDPTLPVGIMLEVPRILTDLEDLAERDPALFDSIKPAFFNVGTNDLAALLTARSRYDQNTYLAFNEFDPSVLKFLLRVKEFAKKHKIPTCICGDIAGQGLAIPLLLGLGFREFSMDSRSIDLARHIIRRISIADAQELTQGALKIGSQEEVLTYLRYEYENFVRKGKWKINPVFLPFILREKE